MDRQLGCQIENIIIGIKKQLMSDNMLTFTGRFFDCGNDFNSFDTQPLPFFS